MTLLTFMFVPLNTFVKSTTDEGRSVIAVITAFLTLELDTGEKLLVSRVQLTIRPSVKNFKTYFLLHFAMGINIVGLLRILYNYIVCDTLKMMKRCDMRVISANNGKFLDTSNVFCHQKVTIAIFLLL